MRISDWSSDVCSSDLRRNWPFRYLPASANLRNRPVLLSASTEKRRIIRCLSAFVPSKRAFTFTVSTPKSLSKMKASDSECRLTAGRSEEHTFELQSLMRISYAVFCLQQTKQHTEHT